MKGRKSLKSRFIAVLASAAIMVGSLSTAAFADDSTNVGFDIQSKGFNVYGIADNGTQIRTTFGNYGYYTKLSVDGSVYRTQSSNFAYGRDFSVNDSNGNAIATANVTASINAAGNAVIITYTVTNNSSEAKEIKIGSSSDCQIGGNDSANVRAYENGLSMTDPKNASNPDDDVSFYLIPGNENFTTLWSGYYGSADGNTFTNLTTHNYNGDSGLAWSWTMNVPAGETVVRTATIAAGVQLTTNTVNFDANGGTGTMESHSFVNGVSEYLPANTFTREGYNFLGWSASADATVPTYTDHGQITVTEDMTLYAVWENRIPDFTAPSANTLTYNAQEQQLVTPGSSTEGTMLYSLEANGTFSDTIPSATASGTYTVYYKVIGDDTHDDTEIMNIEASISPLMVPVIADGVQYEVSAEEAFAQPADPTRDGQMFCGWFADEACTVPYDFSQIVGVNGKIIYAKWVEVSYTIVEGADTSWTTSNEGLVIRVVRDNDEAATFSHFTGVAVDGVALSESDYTAENGSVIVTINSAYLSSLPLGDHTVEILFDDPASVSTTLTVTTDNSAVLPAPTEPSETTAATTETTVETTAAPSETEATTAPSTSVLGVSREVEETTTTAASEETTTTTTAAAATATPTPAPSGVPATGEASNASRLIMGVVLVAMASCFVMKIRKEEN
ncbi:MAG: InlB B-repeat-containing protein [Saccharofermentans sp.]|nr:InlB B-repeat-containing protein [Saccharofermentans sp.]